MSIRAGATCPFALKAVHKVRKTNCPVGEITRELHGTTVPLWAARKGLTVLEMKS